MVKKLRQKFVITAMLSLLLILVMIIGIINIANYVQIQKNADEVLDILSENNGIFPDMQKRLPLPPDSANMNNSTSNAPIPQTPPLTECSSLFWNRLAYNRYLEMPFQSRYFVVNLSKDLEITNVDTTHIAAISSSSAKEYAQKLSTKINKKRGYIDNHYRYLITRQKDDSYLIVFLDCSNSFFNANKLFYFTLLIGIVALTTMLILVYLFSGKAVAPVVESLAKQKRFITDAGHELKTPLAVISANMDVIELESGKSQWTQSSKNQIKRLNGLIKNMLTLSRMEEENIHVVFSNTNFSKIVKECSDTFVSIAESKNYQYTANINEGIEILGDSNALHHLCNILLDNAMKYASSNGNVTVTLSKEANKKWVFFEVSNTCSNIPSGNLDRLFDRFYRADSSRNRETGGYGIGLSVARAIATSHNGTIVAKKDGDNIIRFVVKLPAKNT